MKHVIPAVIAISVGLIVLLGFLLPIPSLVTLRAALTNWAVILGGLAIVIGVINLLMVHARRIDAAEPGWVYSFFTILAFLLALIVGMVEGFSSGGAVLTGSTTFTGILFNGIVVASLAALSSLVMFFLINAAVRLLGVKSGIWSIIFLVTVLIALVGWLPFSGLRLLNGLRQWLIDVPAVAGGRGILLGVGLGTLVVGLRVLTGAERPYKD